MSWARVHRWLAIVLVALLVAWSITGLLFHLKPGWARAYDMLSVERRDRALPIDELQPLPAVQPSTGSGSLQRIELFDTALGPLYRVRTSAGTELVDARTGERRSPLGEVDVRTLAADAVARSAHGAGYGELVDVVLGEQVARVRFSTGAVVEVGRHDARLSQRGPDTDRIDWLYRMHYLQWTGNKAVDRVLAVVGLVLIWAVMIPGLVLFVRNLRGRTAAQ